MNKKKTTSKKEARHQIERKIEIGLADLKTILGEKEFEARVKKAAKIFAKGFKAEPAKEVMPKEKPVIDKEKTTAVPKPTAKKVAKKAAKKK